MDADVMSLDPLAAPSRRSFVATTLVAGFTIAAGPVQAQTAILTPSDGLEAGEVMIPAAGGQMPAYRAMPASGGPFPVVLVAIEVFGVHEYIKDTCRRLAQLGFMAIAGDLFARQGDASKLADVQGAVALARSVPDEQVMGDLDACVAWAKASGKGDTGKLGITGFCNGGRIVWLYAAHNPQLKAGVAWYGPLAANPSPQWPKKVLELVGQLKAPVLGLYGEADQGIPLSDVEKMRAALKEAHKPGMLITYPGAPHGFHADYRPSYRPEAADDGWKRMQAWFYGHGV